jgi:flagellar L-ring protein precursor FlgH
MKIFILSAMVSTLLLGGLGSAQAENLFNEANYRPLAADIRAKVAGDVLTVVVLENSSASTSTGSSAQREHDLGINANIDNRHDLNASIGTENGFDANGKAQRSGRLLAQVSVTVIMVRPNGDLVISGRQIVDINDERQEIVISGVARPIDINSDNTVLSSRLAEASIRYAGQGDLADRQKAGWWSRLFSVLGW